MPVLHDDPGLFVHLVTRTEWQGMPPREDQSGDMTKLEKPVVFVRYTSTGTDKCNTFDSCTVAMQELQEEHVGRQGLVDVKYKDQGITETGYSRTAGEAGPDRHHSERVGMIRGKACESPYWRALNTSFPCSLTSTQVVGAYTMPYCAAFGFTSDSRKKVNGISFHSFLVGGDGKIYEGRGWDHDAQRPPEYDFLKGKCIDIAYFGNYRDNHPPWEMLKAGLDLLKYGLKHQHISPCFEIIPYRDDIEKRTN